MAHAAGMHRGRARLADALWMHPARPGSGTLGTLTTVAREEGARSLWKGLVPGLHRQVLLGGVRIASCEPGWARWVWVGWCRGMPYASMHSNDAPPHFAAPPRHKFATDCRACSCPLCATDDPIRDFYGRLMHEEGGKTSIPTKIAAAVRRAAGTLGAPLPALWPRLLAKGVDVVYKASVPPLCSPCHAAHSRHAGGANWQPN